MSGAMVLQAQGLGVSVRGRPLLSELNLSVAAGECIAVVGHNGAGKSTLLRALSGFAPVSHGSLQVLGTPLAPSPPRASLRRLRQRVAQVHQGLHLVGRLNALDNVLIGCAGRHASPLTWLRRWPASEVAAAHSALERVGLGWAALRRTDTLSGGERQKVALARALLQLAAPGQATQEPNAGGLLLADEPTASLDAQAAQEALQCLRDIAQQQRCTLICVLHDLQALERVAQRVWVLRQGRLVADQPVAPDAPQQLRDWLK